VCQKTHQIKIVQENNGNRISSFLQKPVYWMFCDAKVVIFGNMNKKNGKKAVFLPCKTPNHGD
jgi:hypothetical protein